MVCVMVKGWVKGEWWVGMFGGLHVEGCAICGSVCFNRLSRTKCGMVEWRSVCEVCDLGCEE